MLEFYAADPWLFAWRLVLLLLVMIVVFGYAYTVSMLHAIQARETSTQQDLIARAEALEQRTTRIAEQVQEEAARLAAEAKVRHDLMIETGIQARLAAQAASDEVRRLAERTPPESLMEMAADTNVTVHQIKRHVAEEPLQDVVEDTNVVVHEIKDEVSDENKNTP